jgi:hypothetical protein
MFLKSLSDFARIISMQAINLEQLPNFLFQPVFIPENAG